MESGLNKDLLHKCLLTLLGIFGFQDKKMFAGSHGVRL